MIDSIFQDFKVKQGCHDGVNNLSDILSVSVVYEFQQVNQVASKSLDIVIKLLPQDPFSRFFVTEAQFDLREIKFYTSVSGSSKCLYKVSTKLHFKLTR